VTMRERPFLASPVPPKLFGMNGFNYTTIDLSLVAQDGAVQKSAKPPRSPTIRPAERTLHDVLFLWPYEGDKVQIVGSWGDWKHPILLSEDLDSRDPVKRVTLRLYPGIYAYKFIVDGNWYHDMNREYTRDSAGNINNVVRVTASPTGWGNTSPSSVSDRPVPIGHINR